MITFGSLYHMIPKIFGREQMYSTAADQPALLAGNHRHRAVHRLDVGQWHHPGPDVARGQRRRHIGIYTTLSWFLGLCTYPLLRSRPLRVPPLRRLTLEKRQSKQNALAPPLGASPRLGMPAVRHCSVGPPRSAIPGRVAATPASMPGCPLRNTCLRPSWFNGAPEIKIKSQIKSRATATAKPGREAAFPPCGSWLACDGGVSVDKCIG
jgi:hypothetical protein